MNAKKILAFILAFAMVFSTMSISVFAADITLTETPFLTAENAADWTGNTITIDGENFDYYNNETIHVKGDVALENVTINATKVTASNGLFYISGDTTLTFKNCTINVSESPNLSKVFSHEDSDNAKVVFEGTTLNADKVQRGFYNMEVEMTDSTLNLTNLSDHAFRSVTGSIADTDVTVDGAETFLRGSDIAIVGTSTVEVSNTTHEDGAISDSTLSATPDVEFTGDKVTEEMAETVGAVSIGGKYYTTFSDAVAAATDDDNDGVITYQIHGKVELNPRKVAGKAATINVVGMTTDAELCVNTAKPTDNGIVYVSDNAIETVNFRNLKLSRPNGEWRGNEGHHNRFFTVWDSDGSTDLISYTNCVFPNGSGNNQYGKTTYTDCTFNNDVYYALWIYGSGSAATVEVTGGTFKADRGVKIYSEDASAVVKTTIEDSEFDIASKPAIVSSIAGTLVINEVDATACEYGLLASEPKDGRSDLVSAVVTVDGETPAYVAKVGNMLCTDIDYAKAEADEDDAIETVAATVIDANGVITSYASLTDALAAAEDGDTVTLSADATIATATNFNKNITINLGGNTLNMTAEPIHNFGNELRSAAYYITNDVTFANGAMVVSNSAEYAKHGNFFVEVGKSLTFDNVALTNGTINAYAIIQAYGNVNIVNDTDVAISDVDTRLLYSEEFLADLTVTDSAIDLENVGGGITSSGIDFNASNSAITMTNVDGNALANVNGTVTDTTITITSAETGIKNSVGNLTISGTSEVTVTGSTVADIKLGGNATLDITDDAIVTADNASYVEVNGKYYGSIDDAIEAANAGDTINLFAGTYDAFTVPAAKNNLTFIGETDVDGNNLVTIRTLEEDVDTHTRGIFVQPETAIFKNLNITAGTATNKGGWMTASIGNTNGDTGMGSSLKVLNVENVNFVGSGEHSAIWMNNGSVNFVNSTVDNYKYGVYVYAIKDGQSVNVTGSELSTTNRAVFNQEGSANGSVAITDSVIDAPLLTVGAGVPATFTGNEINNVTFYIYGETEMTDNALIDCKYNTASNGSITLAENYVNNVNDIVDMAVLENIDFQNYYGTEADLANKANLVTVKEKAAKVYVQYKKTDIDADGNDNLEGKDTYEIVLAGADAEKINELASADLTFAFTGDSMSYTVTPAEGVALSQIGDRYMFNYDGITKYEETGAAIVIGTIEINGYGAYTLSTADADTNAVYATEIADNIVDGFTPAAGLITNDDMVADDGMVGKIADGNIAVPTRTLTVDITFPNAVEDNVKAYQTMSVSIVGGTINETIALGTDGEDYNFTRDLPYNTPYTVTVSGAGYRTARYTVTLNEDKTLNFWNNIKDAPKAVEDGKDSSARTVTFLAGDIVADEDVNIYDLSAVVSYFGETELKDMTPEEYAKYVKYDLNRDGKIDSKDVAYVLASWEA